MILPQVTHTLLTSSVTLYVWMQCILHSPDRKMLKEKGWLKCPGRWRFVMLALLPHFEITKRVHTWTSKFPFWSQTHINILRFFFPYHRFTCLAILVLRHRSLRIVVTEMKYTFYHYQASKRPPVLPTCAQAREDEQTSLYPPHTWSFLEHPEAPGIELGMHLLYMHGRKQWHCLKELADEEQDKEQQAGTERAESKVCGNAIS